MSRPPTVDRSVREATVQNRRRHARESQSGWLIKNSILLAYDIKTKTTAVIDEVLHGCAVHRGQDETIGC
jgi:hypothetical protein